MAFGPEWLGIAAFTAVKLTGYSLAGRQLNKRYKVSSPRPVLFGIARTGLGIIAGISLLFLISGIARQGETLFYISLIPVRFAEWMLMLWLFYERKIFSFKRAAKHSVAGIVYSFALDIPAALSAFIIPGGMWIC